MKFHKNQDRACPYLRVLGAFVVGEHSCGEGKEVGSGQDWRWLLSHVTKPLPKGIWMPAPPRINATASSGGSRGEFGACCPCTPRLPAVTSEYLGRQQPQDCWKSCFVWFLLFLHTNNPAQKLSLTISFDAILTFLQREEREGS